MGAGKSTVCRVFESQGALVIDADTIGHETLGDPDVRRGLVAEFGDAVLDSDGRIVRPELGRRAFASPEARERLNAIVWPALGRRLDAARERALQERPDRPVVIDAALLIEWGDPRAFCDVLVVVTARAQLRKERSMQRLGITEPEAEARMVSQLPDDQKTRVADHVIRNDGSPEELEQRALVLWREIAPDQEADNADSSRGRGHTH
jgi:dephospho-CoA kinase